MDDILLIVFKAGEIIAGFAGKLYQKIRGDDQNEGEDGECDAVE
jgi:hypothetical protein